MGFLCDLILEAGPITTPRNNKTNTLGSEIMAGWRDEADADEIEQYAQHTLNNEGRREYVQAYENAVQMISRGMTEEQIRQAIILEPQQPRTNIHGQVGLNGRKLYAAHEALAEVRKKAMEDALQGRKPSHPEH